MRTNLRQPRRKEEEKHVGHPWFSSITYGDLKFYWKLATQKRSSLKSTMLPIAVATGWLCLSSMVGYPWLLWLACSASPAKNLAFPICPWSLHLFLYLSMPISTCMYSCVCTHTKYHVCWILLVQFLVDPYCICWGILEDCWICMYVCMYVLLFCYLSIGHSMLVLWNIILC